jgi:serine phosphatase RsbU (regulator of sigma subunit)
MFVELANLWVQAKLATECKVLLLRQAKDTGKYYIEKISESAKTESRRAHVSQRGERKQTQIIDVQRDMMTETILRFVETDREIDWANRWLVARAPMQVLNEESLLVLALVPNEVSGVPPDRFEEMSLFWLVEVARLHQEVRYKSLAGDIEIARELHRKWLKFSAKNSGEGVACEGVFSCESYSGVKGLGDFIFASNTDSDNVSVTVLGTVGGRDLRSGLAATSVVAALADRFQGVKNADPQKILRGISASINNYLWSVYRGKMTACCSVIVFDHEKGVGHFSSFGMHFPFLLTPMERKPMVIAQIEQCGVLGSSDNYNFVSTSFPVVPGQIVFMGTPGLIELENVHEERFSKHVLSGGLAEIVDNHYSEPAKAILQRVMNAARDYGGVNANMDDMTAVLLTRKFGSIGG